VSSASELLARATWRDLPERPVVVVPVGSTEQHGPHLPMDTDTVIATAVAGELVRVTPGAIQAPALCFGSSGEHQDFPGTLSIGADALRITLIELTRSATTWARRIVFVNGHGGNVTALRAATDQLRHEGHDVDWLPCATEDVDLHAGVTETSLMLHLRPDSVRLERAEAGNTAPLAEILPTMVASGVRAVSANGVLGDPAGADAARGARLLRAMVAQLSPRIDGAERAR